MVTIVFRRVENHTKQKNTDVNQKVTNEPITVVYVFYSGRLFVCLEEKQGLICFENKNEGIRN